MSQPKSILVLGVLPDHMSQALDKLARQGTAVRRVDGPYRLVAAFAAEPADIAVVDLADLRQRDLEILKVLREANPNVGLILMTDRDQRELAGNGLCGGADLYLLKPVNGPEFLAAVERAMLRAELAQAGKPSAGPSDAVYKLAMGVAHEVNNPLTTISGWLQVLASDHAENKQLAGVLHSMKEEVDRIADVVRQLLLFAQQGPPEARPVDLRDLLRELERLHAPRVAKRGGQLKVQVDDDVPPVSGDRKQLRVALDALLEDAAGQDGTANVTVACRPREGGVEIAVHDDGPVIPPETLARIFDPFHDGRGGKAKGLGLGLTQGIIGSHGGTIEAASSPQEGTRFTIWLPAQR